MSLSQTVKLLNRYFHWLKNEDKEQAEFVLWLEEKNYKFTSIPNSTWTKSAKQKIMNYLTGLRPWLCDLLIILKKWKLAFIEMKRPWRILKNWKVWASPSVVSENQKVWIKELQKLNNVSAKIAYWKKEAIEIIKELEKCTF